MGLVKAAPWSNTTFKVIGTRTAVHNDLGPGHREQAYQNALAARLRQVDVAFEEQIAHEVCGAGGVPVALCVPDFFLDDSVIVEIQAQSHQLIGDNMAQSIDYLAGSTCQLRFL